MEIKRAGELVIISLLNEALPTLIFRPCKGDDDNPNPAPPFGTVEVEKAEHTLPLEKTSLLTGKVTWITKADVTPSDTHSATVQDIYKALFAIGSGYDAVTKINVHGFDVLGLTEDVDTERRAHMDVISFSMGVTDTTE